MTTRHIRPKIRKAAARPSRATSDDSDAAVEAIRSKLEQWMGISDAVAGQKSICGEQVVPAIVEIPAGEVEIAGSTCAHHHQEDPHHRDDDRTPKKPSPKGILKTPKYSAVAAKEGESTKAAQSQNSIFKQTRIQEHWKDSTEHRLQSWIPPADPKLAATAVEGYQLQMDHNKRIRKDKLTAEVTREDTDAMNPQGDTDGPLIFHSLTDMMEVAGNLPPQNLEDGPQVVEAELAFSCMSPDEYQAGLIWQGMEQREAQAEKERQDRTPEWKQPPAPLKLRPMGDDSEEDTYKEDEDEEYVDDNDSDFEDDILDIYGGDQSEDPEEAVAAPPRTFRVLWECLSQLITPRSCAFLRRVDREENATNSYVITTNPRSDLEFSRANGFLAMLRMYMNKALQELDQPLELRRKAEQRLQGLLYTFDFSRPAARLESRQWKALTCVLIEMVLFSHLHADDDGPSERALPASATAAAMTPEEYRYLVRKTIPTFDIPGLVI